MNTLLRGLCTAVSISSFLACTNTATTDKQEKKSDSTAVSNAIQLLPPVADAGSAEPFLFTGSNNQVYLSWVKKSADSATLRYARLTDSAWSSPVDIGRGADWFVNWADYPVMASNGDQHLIAHYLQKMDSTGHTYAIQLITTANGINWQPAGVLNADTVQAEHGFVSLVPYKDGYLACWLDGRNAAMPMSAAHAGHGGQMSLRAALLNKSGKKENEWELDSRVCDCCQTSATITDSGPVLVYRDRSADETRDISIVRYINGRWTSPATVFADNWKIEGCPVNGPRVDAIGNNLGLAWFTSARDTAAVKMAFSVDGGATFSQPIRIDEGKGIGRVDIAMLNENTAMVSWMEGPLLKAVKVNRNGSKEPSMVIAHSSAARSSGFPQMTRAGNNLYFAWTNDSTKTIATAMLRP
ncbi:MAG TPA: hypothetical protein VL307_01335 [Chitinophagaceae bacterium]|nr:hypothetical protein [Chitinophagaceae bacterium]